MVKLLGVVAAYAALGKATTMFKVIVRQYINCSCKCNSRSEIE